MKRFTSILTAAIFLAFALAPAAQASFGLKDLDFTLNNANGSVAPQAGAHPYSLNLTLGFNTRPEPVLGFEVPDGDPKDLEIAQLPGLVGNPTVVPRCSNAEFVVSSNSCPASSQVGVTDVTFSEPGNTERFPVYSLTPPPGVAMKLGWHVLFVPVTAELRVRESPPYNVIASLSNIPNVEPIYSAKTTIWGVPADPAHNAERPAPVSLTPKPFLTAPRACTGPLPTSFKADSWNAGSLFEETIFTHDDSTPPNPLGMTGCGSLAFSPSIEAQPTSKAASSPTGLDLSVDVADEGLSNPEGLANSDIRKAVITLPQGMSANPSLAEGLGVCSEEELARETATSAAGAGCPEAAKIGAVEVETPLLENQILTGSLFVAKPYENPFGTLLALYMTIKDPDLGIGVHLAGKVIPDPRTGQLVATFDELPQLPVSHFRTHLREGGRSPLISPANCGTHTATAEFTPWAGGVPLTTTSSFQVSRGPNGGPCPAGGVPPFHPGFEAGAINNNAGSYSPYYMHLTRGDGEQELTKFSTVLPSGSVAKLVGVSRCSDAQIAAAKSNTGRQELASPSCPANSQIGRVLGGAGAGDELTYVPGKVYLAGAYNGAPLSAVAVVPAVAGPFDVGTVVTRLALSLDPETGIAHVDGSRSDPIPHILAGIPLSLRDVRAYVDRPDFTLNPTSCDPEAFKAQLWGSAADVFSVADDSPVSLTARFQAASCASLRFKPTISLKLQGGTRRADHPALKSVVDYPRGPGYANLEKAVVTLPPSVFIDNAHIQNPCTRVQFNANQCPKGSVLGNIKAFTPLLDEPLEGPVYFRSNGGERLLPDVVFDLHGLFHLIVVGHVDAVNARVRVTFEKLPDAPVSKVLLSQFGGKKGLFVNNRNLCAHKQRAIIELTGQNGKVSDTKPLVTNSCGKKGKRGGKRALRPKHR